MPSIVVQVVDEWHLLDPKTRGALKEKEEQVHLAVSLVGPEIQKVVFLLFDVVFIFLLGFWKRAYGDSRGSPLKALFGQLMALFG